MICQLMSYIAKELVTQAMTQYQSDQGYTEMLTYRQLVFIMYRVISRYHTLSILCDSLLQEWQQQCFWKKSPITLYPLPRYLSQDYLEMFINDEISPARVEIFDSSTISLFVEVFKGAGCTPASNFILSYPYQAQYWI